MDVPILPYSWFIWYNRYQTYNELKLATMKPHNIDRCVVTGTHPAHYDDKP